MLTYGVTPTEQILTYDGLGFLQALIDRKLPAPPISETLGFLLVAVEHGKAVFEGLPTFKHYNPIGVVHGGFTMTLMDSCMACAIQTTLARSEEHTSELQSRTVISYAVFWLKKKNV